MYRFIRGFAKCLLVAAAGSIGAAEVEEVQLTIHPRAIAQPVMSHRLTPSFLDERPGDAAPMYLKALLLLANQKVESSVWDDVTKWAAAPLDEIPIDEARKLLSRFDATLTRIEAASLRQRCDWNLNIRDSEQPFLIQLPEVMHAREIGRLLALKARLQIAEGEIEEAIDTLRTGFTLASHVSCQPTLISGLVGIAIEHLMTAQMETLLASAETPNLYWSLTALPQPLSDLRHGLRFEQVSLFMLFPRLTELESTQYTAGQWDRFAVQIFAKTRDMHTLVGEAEQVEWLKNLDPEKVVTTEYPRAKRELIRRGYSAAEVEAMPQSKAVLLDFSLSYQEVRDDVFKWFYVPVWQAKQGHASAETNLKSTDGAGVGRRFIALLVPTIRAAHDAAARAEQRIALLRMIEAIRHHMAKHGSLPTNAADITDVPVPIDPFTGKLFELQHEDGVVILDTLQRGEELTKRYQVSKAEGKP